MKETQFSDPRVQESLDEPMTAVLATINPDGSPLATPMWFVRDEKSLGMVSVEGLQKIRNLRRDPRVSVVVQTEDTSGLQCVIIQGSVEFLDDDKERAAFGALLVEKYGEEIERRWGGRSVPRDRALFRIHPRRVKLWG